MKTPHLASMLLLAGAAAPAQEAEPRAAGAAAPTSFVGFVEQRYRAAKARRWEMMLHLDEARLRAHEQRTTVERGFAATLRRVDELHAALHGAAPGGECRREATAALRALLRPWVAAGAEREQLDATLAELPVAALRAIVRDCFDVAADGAATLRDGRHEDVGFAGEHLHGVGPRAAAAAERAEALARCLAEVTALRSGADGEAALARRLDGLDDAIAESARALNRDLREHWPADRAELALTLHTILVEDPTTMAADSYGAVLRSLPGDGDARRARVSELDHLKLLHALREDYAARR